MRSLMSKEQLKHNAECFNYRCPRLIDFTDDKAMIVYNGDWLYPLNYLEFMRDIGGLFLGQPHVGGGLL